MTSALSPPGRLVRPSSFAGLLLASVLAFSTASPASAVALPDYFQDQLLVGGLDWPTGITFLPDRRLILVELKTAKVRMIVEGNLASVDPIGTVDSVQVTQYEQGLFAVASDPRWPDKPFLYFMYTALGGHIRVSRVEVAGDLSDGTSGNLALVPGSRRDLIRDVVDVQENHNGGCLRFGPDEMLYVSFAEDANACQACDSTALFGVLTRMDVRNLPDTPGPPDKDLLVPVDNPYADRPDVDTRLMYARGFRNPFRFHIDAPTQRIFLADVGWDIHEEIDLVDAPALNFGWPFMEGSSPRLTPGQCGVPPPTYTMVSPIYEYGNVYPGAAVIGGVVFRHVDASPVSFPAAYDGRYLFSDYYKGFLWMIRDSSGVWVKTAPEPGQPNASDWGQGYDQASDYLLGPDGAVYYAKNAYAHQSFTGEVRRIIYTNPVEGVGDRRGAGVSLATIYPSPAHGSATMRYVLARPARVRLTLYDALGRRVRQLVPESDRPAGEHRVRWDGNDEAGRRAAPGVYVARLVTDGAAVSRRVPLVR